MRRLPSPLYLAVPFLALGLFGGPAGAEPPQHGVPEVRRVQLDGSPGIGEWADALALPIDAGTSIRMQQYRGTLMLSFRSDRIWTPGSILTLFFCPDGPKAGGRGPGCLRIDYEPFRHNRAHTIAFAYDASGVAQRIHGQVVVRHRIGDDGAQLELAMPIKLLRLTTERRFPVRFCAQWARHGATPLTYPVGIDLRGSAANAPVDFVSAGRWARLKGWGDPAGQGAYPASEWKAWIQHDAEITRRGKAAHNRIQLLSEEWHKETKADKALLAEVIEPLAWIRQHEPLTPDDILAMATLWRYLNQHARAAAMLGVLVDSTHNHSIRMRALHMRALVFRAWERYDEEAADWKVLGQIAGPLGGRYTQASEGAVVAKAAWAKEQAARRRVEADAALPRVRFETARGPVTVVLHAGATPESVKHFLALVESKFYDKTRFCRVKGDFMAQGGDPKSGTMGCDFAGSGSSPTEIDGETNAGHDFYRGALCYARAGHKETNGSQFFIMTAPKPALGRYTIFGHVVNGMAAVDRLEHNDLLTRAVALPK